VKVGASIPFAGHWTADFSYSRYWIDSTATVNTDTPGFGVISRKIDLTADPDVFGLAVGYSF
jgi:outer membrane protein